MAELVRVPSETTDGKLREQEYTRNAYKQIRLKEEKIKLIELVRIWIRPMIRVLLEQHNRRMTAHRM